MDDDRKQAVMNTLMPTDLKKMQRCLGVGMLSSEFIPDYATKTAELYDMIKPTFNLRLIHLEGGLCHRF